MLHFRMKHHDLRDGICILIREKKNEVFLPRVSAYAERGMFCMRFRGVRSFASCRSVYHEPVARETD